MGLIGISPLISPDLLRVLSQMGHGDEIVLADIHFPATSTCGGAGGTLRADGHGSAELLEVILALFPLDTYVDKPAAVMHPVPGDTEPPVWKSYKRLLDSAHGKEVEIEQVERFAFYARAQRAFAIVQTGETAKYGNIILKKGLVKY